MSLEHEIENKIVELATEICEREGCVLYDVDYGESKKVVAVFIDKEGGVDLDDCAKVSSGLNFALDVEDLITKSYNLEVSSPGLERHLKQKWHFEKQIEKQINVVIKARTETSKALGAKHLKGVLKKVEDEKFVVESDQGKSFELPYEDVHKCNVIFEF